MRSATSTVFVVDEDPIWCMLLSKMLSEAGIRYIVHFNEPLDCLKYLHLQPGLIFLDYKFGDSQRVDWLNRIRQLDDGVNIIFCAASNAQEVGVNTMKNGCSDYLLKSSCTVEALRSLI